MIPITALGDALEAFILEHEYCGELDATVEVDRVWMTCTSGGRTGACRGVRLDSLAVVLNRAPPTESRVI